MTASGFHRAYTAIVEGWPEAGSHMISNRLAEKMAASLSEWSREDGQYARTDVEVLRRFQKDGNERGDGQAGSPNRKNTSNPRSYAVGGHPLAGDDLYGGNENISGASTSLCINRV